MDTLALVALPFALVVVTASLAIHATASRFALRRERQRSAERAELDRRLIEALEFNVAAQTRRAEAAAELVRVHEALARARAA